MAKLTVYTKCAGEIVTLNRSGYLPPALAGKATVYEGQQRFVITVDSRGPKMSGFSYLAGWCSACGALHFAERQIERPANSSNHVCSDKCRSARGGKCECSCGGKYHGCN